MFSGKSLEEGAQVEVLLQFTTTLNMPWTEVWGVWVQVGLYAAPTLPTPSFLQKQTAMSAFKDPRQAPSLWKCPHVTDLHRSLLSLNANLVFALFFQTANLTLSYCHLTTTYAHIHDHEYKQPEDKHTSSTSTLLLGNQRHSSQMWEHTWEPEDFLSALTCVKRVSEQKQKTNEKLTTTMNENV